MNKTAIGLMTLLVMLGGACACWAQDLSYTDQERALHYLESTRQGLETAIAGLSDAQWKFNPGPDRWSPAQIMEHLACAEDFLRETIQNEILTRPAVTFRDAAEVKRIDDAVLKIIPDRSQKVELPEPAQPTNQYGSPIGSEKHFLKSREKTETFLKNATGLREHVADADGMKMDAYEWVLLIGAHCERLTREIDEIKANPNFPTK
jgi:DinB family protein